MTRDQLHWLAAYLRTARDDEDFASDPKGVELLDQLDNAIRAQPKAVRDVLQKPWRPSAAGEQG